MSCLFKVTLDGIFGLMFLFIHLKNLIFSVLGNSLCTMTLSGFSVIFLEHAFPSTLSGFSLWTVFCEVDVDWDRVSPES